MEGGEKTGGLLPRTIIKLKYTYLNLEMKEDVHVQRMSKD
jgi:hypothetical protein